MLDSFPTLTSVITFTPQMFQEFESNIILRSTFGQLSNTLKGILLNPVRLNLARERKGEGVLEEG